ncbi:MAG: RNA polymerase sigma-54 factor, partial [Gammaproteobacteria bacterium]
KVKTITPQSSKSPTVTNNTPGLTGPRHQKSHSNKPRETESITQSTGSLQAHLHEQAVRTPLSKRQHLAVELIIDSLQDNGYLDTGLRAIIQHTQGQENLTLKELEFALHQVQCLEPSGVGCRDLTECLSIQLDSIAPQSDITRLAKILIQDHLNSLGRSSYKALIKELDVDGDLLQQAISLIKSLDPSPGSQIESTATLYVSPDITVSKRDGRWQAELNREHIPQISLCSYTRDWLTQVKDPIQKKPLLEQVSNAKLLLSQIENRYQTTLKVAIEIVDRQQAYFERGNIALQPLTLKQISEALGIHISTVSRTVNDKYLLSNRGLAELKFFFSTAVPNHNGEQSSARSVQAVIQKLIMEELPNKPLSDHKITQHLNESGLQVARRTVAKYREKLNIPASAIRKQLSNPSGVSSPGIN